MKSFHIAAFAWAMCFALSLSACSPGTQVRQSNAVADDNNAKRSSASQSLKQDKIPRLEAISGEKIEDDSITTEEADMATDVAGAYLRQPPLKELGNAIAVRVQDSAQKISWELYELIIQRPLADEPNLMILYQVELEGKTVFGLIPRSLLKFQESSLSVPLRGPGHYRAVSTSTNLSTEPTYVLDNSTMSGWLLSSHLMAVEGTPTDVHLANERMYIAHGTSVSDYSYEPTPEGWKKLGSYSFGTATPQSLVVTRNRLYASEPKTGLASYQMPSPNNTPAPGLRPTVESTSTTLTYGIALSGPTRNMYLLEEASTAASPAKLRVSRFDIQQADPIFENSFNIAVGSTSGSGPGGGGPGGGGPGGGGPGGGGAPSPRILVADTKLFVLFESGLLTIDVTNNDRFNQLSFYNKLDRPTAFAFHAVLNRLYVSDRTGSIHVLDMTDASNPVLLQQLNFKGNIQDLLIMDQHLFATDNDRLLHRFDLSQTSALSFKDSLALQERPLRLRAYRNELLIPLSKKGLQRILVRQK